MRLRRTPGTRPGGLGTGIFVVGFAARRHTSLYYTGSAGKSQGEACKFYGMKEEKQLRGVRSPISPSSVASRKLLAVFLPPPGGRHGEQILRWFHSPISPSSGTGVPPSPPGGRLRSVVHHFQAIPLSHTYKSALFLTTRNCRSSLPPGGGRKTASSLREATDEGETGERHHRTPRTHPSVKVFEDS